MASYDATLGTGPTSQGFQTQVGVISGSLIVNDNGYAAYSFSGSDCCGYYYNSSANSSATSAFNAGWIMSGRMRLADGTNPLGGITWDPGLTHQRFDMHMLLDSNGDTKVVLFEGNAFDNGASYVIPNSGRDWFEYALTYDPVTAKASLAVNGNTVLTGYAGNTWFREDRGLMISSSSDTGNYVSFNYVRLAAIDPSTDPDPAPGPVPEPSTYAMAGSALAVLWWARRRRPC